MFWHIDTDIISFIVIVAMIVNYRLTMAKQAQAKSDKHFYDCMIVGAVVTLVDISASVIMEVPVHYITYHVIMTIYFLGIEFAIAQWLLYSADLIFGDRQKIIRCIRFIVCSIYAVYAVTVLSNPWTGIIFRLGKNNEYSRGPFFSGMIVVFSLYVILLFIMVVLRWKKIPSNYSEIILILVPIILSISIAVQLLNPGWLMILPAYMICLVLAYMFLQVKRSQSDQKLMKYLSKAALTDQLTGLYNRTGMEALIQKSLAESHGETCCVIMADLDDLKYINDTFGHSAGDTAIKSFALILKKQFYTTDVIVRYGGDEFLVLLIGDIKENQINLTLSALLEELSKAKINMDSLYAIHGSVGVSLGVVGVDEFDKLKNQADTALYHVKRNGKNNFAFYSSDMMSVKYL